jgi:hypothetical protein
MARLQQKKQAAVTTGSAGSSDIPCAMALTVCFVLSPGTGLSCPRRFVDHPAKLGASVGASGPHDFTVRDLDVRLTQGRVHRIPLPTFVTIAKRPSSRPRDARKSARDLPDGTSALACDMLARRAICAWQVCWTRGPRIAARRRRHPLLSRATAESKPPPTSNRARRWRCRPQHWNVSC